MAYTGEPVEQVEIDGVMYGVQKFIVPGSGIFNPPAGITQGDVLIVGGGGGAGGTSGTGTSYGGDGGKVSLKTNLVFTADMAVVVGDYGDGRYYSATPTAGGNSSFAGYIATGGKGGMGIATGVYDTSHDGGGRNKDCNNVASGTGYISNFTGVTVNYGRTYPASSSPPYLHMNNDGVGGVGKIGVSGIAVRGVSGSKGVVIIRWKLIPPLKMLAVADNADVLYYDNGWHVITGITESDILYSSPTVDAMYDTYGMDNDLLKTIGDTEIKELISLGYSTLKFRIAETIS